VKGSVDRHYKVLCGEWGEGAIILPTGPKKLVSRREYEREGEEELWRERRLWSNISGFGSGRITYSRDRSGSRIRSAEKLGESTRPGLLGLSLDGVLGKLRVEW
jgi:hypothetical protein